MTPTYTCNMAWWTFQCNWFKITGIFSTGENRQSPPMLAKSTSESPLPTDSQGKLFIICFLTDDGLGVCNRSILYFGTYLMYVCLGVTCYHLQLKFCSIEVYVFIMQTAFNHKNWIQLQFYYWNARCFQWVVLLCG